MTLRDSDVDIQACDLPQAGTLEFGIRAVFAQHEREEACERTRVALAAAKARGKKLGKNGKKLAKANKVAADKFARRLAATVRKLRVEHTTLRSLANALNQAGIASFRNTTWSATTVMRLLQRID